MHTIIVLVLYILYQDINLGFDISLESDRAQKFPSLVSIWKKMRLKRYVLPFFNYIYVKIVLWSLDI